MDVFAPGSKVAVGPFALQVEADVASVTLHGGGAVSYRLVLWDGGSPEVVDLPAELVRAAPGVEPQRVGIHGARSSPARQVF